MITFATPAAFLLLLLVPLFFERNRRGAAARGVLFTSPLASSELQQLARRSVRSRLRGPFLTVLQVLTFVLLVTALSRPQLAMQMEESEAQARDLIFALDISGSMKALDFFIGENRVDRLTALKAVMKQFIDKRQGDRLALIVFGDRVFTQCPLTLDHDVVQELVQALEVGMAGQGTAIGDAVGIALKKATEIPGASKAIILVTDGKSNSGTLTPLDSAELAKKMGVKVYVIGIGSAAPAPFPTKNIFGMTVLTSLPMEYDEKTLRQIAEVTGGVYFNAKDTEGLERIYGEIAELEERRERAPQFVEVEERYLPYLAAAIVLLFVSELVAATVFLRVP